MDTKKLEYLNQLNLDINNVKEAIHIVENFTSARLVILYNKSFGNERAVTHKHFDEIYKRHFKEIVKEMKEVCDKLEREFGEL